MCAFEKISANALQKRCNEVGMKRKFTILFAILIVALTACCLFACNDKGDLPAKVDYQSDNSFFVKTAESETALTFEPILDPVYSESGLTYKPVDYRFGIIFYVGANVNASAYTYIGNSLAKQGYLVVIESYKSYQTTEIAFSQYPNIKFFVGGHSQGGGFAVRRAFENQDGIKGAILLAPTTSRRPLLDADGNQMKDENGIDIFVPDTLSETSMPTILINADNDKILLSSEISAVKNRMPSNYVDKTVENGCHTGFCEIYETDNLPFKFPNFIADFNATDLEQKQSQRTKTVEYILDFVKGLSN